jgi:hypothetical protein
MDGQNAPAAEDFGMENLTGRQARVSGWCCSRWAGLALVGGVFFIAAALSWRRWPDVLVDFGMQLYLPWRISEGAGFGRDVMYLPGGPLSQYFNALLFKIFGVSFRTLIFSNLAITAGLLVMIHRRFLIAADRLTAMMIGLGIVLVFAFGHYQLIGNYNYVTPYCHEIFHGLALSLVTVTWLADWIERGKIRFAAVAGLGCGLVFLTKPEIFLALAVGVLAAFVIVCFWQRRIHFALSSLAVLLPAGLAPLTIFFVLFLKAGEDWRSGLQGVFCAWVPLGQAGIGSSPYYQWCLGLDTPFEHLGKMAMQFMALGAAVAVFARIFRSHGEPPSVWLKWPRLLLPLAVLVASVLAVGSGWMDCGRSLPLLALSACVMLGLNGRRGAVASQVIFPLLWNVFALALLAKMGFFTRIWHYGFVLAMPAFTGAVYLLVWLLPAWLERKCKVRFHPFRLAVCVVLATVFVRLFLCSEHWYLQKTVPVGRAGDRIMAYDPSVNPFHDNVQLALSWIQENTPATATVAVLPEGAMINYLARRMNPTLYPVWLPPEMEVFGQTNMTAAFERNAPDYVLLLSRNTVEYGVGPFGHDVRYGLELRQWLEEHYDAVDPGAGIAGEVPVRNAAGTAPQILKRHRPDATGRFPDVPAPATGKN